MSYSRYAIYYAPEPGPLAEFAAHWLGWDPELRVTVAHPALAGLPRPLAALTAEPRKYGFHGTLKAPFRLAEARDEAMLRRELEALAAGLDPVVLPGLRLSRIGRFLALTPRGDTDALETLAARVVRDLDPLRAPMTAAERARRRPEALTPPQAALLDRWGYPYVMEEFRFHLTLTGPLEAAEAAQVEAVLAPVLEPLLAEPFAIRSLCLFGEAADGRFHLLHRAAIG